MYQPIRDQNNLIFASPDNQRQALFYVNQSKISIIS